MATKSRQPKIGRRRHVRRGLLLLLLFAGLAAVAEAATVSPMSIYLTREERSGVITVFNPGTEPEEVTIDFVYGYSASDEEGRPRVMIFDSAGPGEPSLVPYLRAFPRRFTLQPEQRQAVRILVQPAADLPRGEYWARILVTGQGGNPPVEQQTREGVVMRFNLRTTVAVAVTYRNGDLTTGLDVAAASAEATAAGVDLVLDLDRLGDAAFLGVVDAEVEGPQGVVGRITEPVAVYKDMRLRLTVPLERLPQDATVRYAIRATRTDLPDGAALPAPPVSGKVPVQRRP